MTVFYIVLAIILVLYTGIMVPLQYAYISSMNERKKQTGKNHNELFDDMSFEEQQLHYNLQSSWWNWLPAIIATWIYKRRHKTG